MRVTRSLPQTAKRPPVRLPLIAPLSFIAVAGLSLGLIAAFGRTPDNQVAPGVQVGQLDLSRKSLDEAHTALSKWAKGRLSAPVLLHFAPESHMAPSWKTEAKKLGLGIDVDATLEAAQKVGHDGVLSQVSQWISGAKSLPVAAVTTVDTAKLRAYLKQIAKQVNRAPKNARIVVASNGYFSRRRDKAGLGLDTEASAAAITQAWKQANAGSVADTEKNPAIQTPESSDNNTPKTDTNTQSTPSANDTASQPIAMTLAMKTVPASITYADLMQMDVDEPMGTFRTHFGGTGESRGDNIALAAGHINGILLRPGETFSYNKVVGPRDDSAGFKTAPQIVDGKLVPGIGGGVCQVSSTLYNAVLKADLKIVRRSHHGFPVHYLPAGRDATVSYDDLDFQFQNNTETPIYLSASSGGGSLRFNVFGKRTKGKSVDIELVGHTIIPSPVETHTDSSLPAGRRVVEEEGRDGHRVTVYRVVKQDGKVIRRELISRDHYRAFPRVIAVGTGVRASKPRPAISRKVTPASPVTVPGQ